MMEQRTNTTKDKFIKFAKFALSVAILLGIGFVIFNYVPFIAKYETYAIGSGSMEPIIMTGDMVLIDTSVAPEDIEPGTIIAFYPGVDVNDDGIEDVIVHFLYSAEEIAGEVVIRTKPNTTDALDDWEITYDDIIGVHRYTVSSLGSFLMFAQSTFGRIILIVDIIVIYFAVELFSSSNKAKKKDIKELEESIEQE